MLESFEYGATSSTVFALPACVSACLGVSSTEIRLGLVSGKLRGPCTLTLGTEEHKMNTCLSTRLHVRNIFELGLLSSRLSRRLVS